MGRSRVEEIRLTKREKQIALLVSEGYSNQEIAAKLFITKKYVEHCMARIYKYYEVEAEGAGRVKLAFKIVGDVERCGIFGDGY